jgi:hypothetical protein
MSEFVLPTKKVYIKPNLSNPGWVKNPKSPAFFKMEGTFDRLVCPQLRSGQLTNVLTNDEKLYLEQAMHMDTNELSIHKKKDNFWHNQYISLGRDTVTLDLSTPLDYIKYKIAIANKYLVAESESQARARKTKYYIEDLDDVQRINKEKTNLAKTAWSSYGKMENNASKLRTFLIIFNESFGHATKKIAKDAQLGFLQKEVSDIIEKRIKDYVEIINNPDYDIREIISEGVQSEVLEKQGLKYFIAGSKEKIGDDLIATISFLKNPSNQETRLLIEERIKLQK